jgi:hypothetical protein
MVEWLKHVAARGIIEAIKNSCEDGISILLSFIYNWLDTIQSVSHTLLHVSAILGHHQARKIRYIATLYFSYFTALKVKLFQAFN